MPRRSPSAGLPAALALALTATWLSGCASPHPANSMSNIDPAAAALEHVKQTFAPDPHTAVFNLHAARDAAEIVLTGEVDNPEAKKQALAALAPFGPVRDQILVLPDPALGPSNCGLPSVSVLNVREKPGNASEMGTQILMGNPFKILQTRTNWFLVQSDDGYLGWTEGGPFTRATPAEVQAWTNSPLQIVTTLEDRILEKPDPQSLPISDVILCDLVKRVGETGDWLRVQLPDGRAGFLPKTSAQDFAAWRAARQPTPDNIERDAKSFLGRPYFWGCNTPRGMDCSGFTKLVYYLNGVALTRNASQQAAQGLEIPLDPEFTQLKKGDLLFFGRHATAALPEKVDHVGIYLGDKQFIQSTGLVKISSLDPNSPLHDDRRIRRLLHARRLLPPSQYLR